MVTDEQIDAGVKAACEAQDEGYTDLDVMIARALSAVLPSAKAEARREALEGAAAKLEYVAAELEADRAVIEPDSTYDDVAIRTLRTAITAIRALASQPPAPPSDGWQPMETAPRDGTPVLVYGLPTNLPDVHFSRPAVYTAYWDDMDQTFCLSGASWRGPFVHEPTAWRPLPAPPKET